MEFSQKPSPDVFGEQQPAPRGCLLFIVEEAWHLVARSLDWSSGVRRIRIEPAIGNRARVVPVHGEDYAAAISDGVLRPRSAA